MLTTVPRWTQPAPAGDSALAPAIVVRGLAKRYGDVAAVRGVDLEVQRGEIFAFLGPNGAGKTTTVEILEGFRERSQGDVEVLGVDPARAPAGWRRRIGVVLQESAPDPGLTAREVVELYAGYHDRPRPVAETLELVGLTGQAGRRATALSGGERRRLDVATALVGDPELIFLDEPTTGFDPAARRAAWAMVEGLRTLGKTIFLTTHYMDEAERLADRIAVIVSGRIVARGTPATLGGRDGAPTRIGFSIDRDDPPLPDAIARQVRERKGSRVVLESSRPLDDLALLARFARDTGVTVRELEVSRPGLEDVYLALIGRTGEPE